MQKTNNDMVRALQHTILIRKKKKLLIKLSLYPLPIHVILCSEFNVSLSHSASFYFSYLLMIP